MELSINNLTNSPLINFTNFTYLTIKPLISYNLKLSFDELFVWRIFLWWNMGLTNCPSINFTVEHLSLNELSFICSFCQMYFRWNILLINCSSMKLFIKWIVLQWNIHLTNCPSMHLTNCSFHKLSFDEIVILQICKFSIF